MTSSFSAEWLALREPADHRARSRRLVTWLAETLPSERPWSLLDLAAGTGSNARYFVRLLPKPQSWMLVDRDAALLSVAERSTDCEITTRVVDLVHMDRHDAIFGGRDLVTASALLDLVSGAWLRALLLRCRRASARVLFALTYDGRMECEPRDPDDDLVRALVNRHQRTDKGFGPALGPEAVGHTVVMLEELGYDVAREQSDWRLADDDRELQRQLIVGWADAATEMSASDAKSIANWRARRLAHVVAGRSTIRVGHEDLAARVR